MAINPETTVRKIMSLPHPLAARVEEFRFANRIKTEAEAFRRLIELGLEAAKTDRTGDSERNNRQ